MLETLGADYIRTARAKGLAKRSVNVKHALRNAMLPVSTVIGLQSGSLLGGAFLTETVFAWPGIGKFAVDCVLKSDFPGGTRRGAPWLPLSSSPRTWLSTSSTHGSIRVLNTARRKRGDGVSRKKPFWQHRALQAK